MSVSALAKKRLLAWGVLLLGLLLSVMLGLQVKQDIEDDAHRQFAFAGAQVALKVSERLAAYQLILRGASGLFATSGTVSRQAWKQYVEQVQADKIVPGVQGIGFSQLITAPELAGHIAAVRAEGFADYTVRPPGERPLYTSIVYLEPFRDRNLRAFGYDMFSEPVRRAAMSRARDDGVAALTSRVELVQEDGTDPQAGVLMYVPVYRQNMPLRNAAERSAALLGWVYSPFRMKDLMSGILQGWQASGKQQIGLRIFAGERASPEALLYDSVSIAAQPLEVDHRETIDFNGQVWLLEYTHPPISALVSYGPAWAALLGGFALSGLLFGLLLSLLYTRANAQVIADKLTDDIRKNERLLAESEQRWKFALEGSGLGVWDWNVADGTVFYSQHLKAMLGYAEDEFGGDLDEWKSRVHPDDLEATLLEVQRVLDGATPYYDTEHRLCCKDGRYIWIRDRGMVIARDAHGTALRMIGTHSDVSAQKQLQEEREEYYRFFVLSRDAMGIADPLGSFRRVNPALVELLGYAEEELLNTPFAAYVHPDDRAATLDESKKILINEPTVNFENRYLCKDGRVVDLAWRTYFDRESGLCYSTARDITGRKQAESHIRQLTQLYAALSHCNSAIVRCNNRDELFARICQIVVDDGGMGMAWIGLTEEASGRIVPLASYGAGLEYLEGIEISARADDPHGNGPTGTAIRENHTVWLEDFPASPMSAPWHERAAGFGWCSSAALPIRLAGKSIGALTIYSCESREFDHEVQALLEEMVSDVSFALDIIASNEREHSYQATLLESEQRFRSLVEQSIAGAYIIQGGRFVYVNPRMAKILGYESPEGLMGGDPVAQVAAKDRARVAGNLALLLKGEQQHVESVFTVLRADGTTVEVGTNSSVAMYQGQPAIIGLLQDISDSRVAEEQIRRYTAQLEKNFIQTVGLATTLSEMRDPYTAGHEQRVAEISVAIGREMGLDKDRLEGLRIGGYLHDVGKITVPAEILVKPTRLTPNEYALIKEHPKAGYEVLKTVDFPWPVADIAYQHHERIDGSGYPQGLKGEAILLEARITAVADVIESMASHRPYRPGLGIDTALAEVERGMGVIYDAEVARVALSLFRDKGYVLPA